MVDDDARFCETQILKEERLAQGAPSPEAAEMHHQAAMLYKIQLAVLTRTKSAGLGARPHQLIEM